MRSIITSLRITAFTMLICVLLYSTVVFGFAQLVTPDKAAGSLISDEKGNLIGSRLVAQNFTRPEYFWPRPSAVDYDGSGAGGSNLSPTSRDLTERGQEIVQRYGATAQDPLSPELAAASGSGLDPHLTEQAALYQVERVARARGVSASRIVNLVRESSFVLGRFITEERLVNVLELNMALDRLAAPPG